MSPEKVNYFSIDQFRFPEHKDANDAMMIFFAISQKRVDYDNLGLLVIDQ